MGGKPHGRAVPFRPCPPRRRRNAAALCNFGDAPAVYDGELGEAPVLLLHTDMTEFGGDTEESDLNLEKPLILPPYSGMLLRI